MMTVLGLTRTRMARSQPSGPVTPLRGSLGNLEKEPASAACLLLGQLAEEGDRAPDLLRGAVRRAREVGGPDLGEVPDLGGDLHLGADDRHATGALGALL